ncbi:MAG TPA: 3-dehydroquinate synthase II [bacterium]|nr:3-dehydroquinate synthase II [bacterium]
MKQFWVAAEPYAKELITAALEAGAQAVLVPAGTSADVHALGRITTIAPDGDLVPGRDAEFVTIRNKQDEERAAALPADRWVVVTLTDWTVIPLENLIARRGKLIARVTTAREAELALGILERGVDGILLADATPALIAQVAGVLARGGAKFPLVPATVTAVKQLGMGDRVCVDTCSELKPGEGMLVGNSTGAMFLVHSESLETPYVNARPFRVNAGPLHAYVYGTDERTPYLSDLKAGDAVLAVDHTGATRPVVVGRIKTERRPLLLVEAQIDGTPVSCILQNAETIRLTAPDGSARSVATLAPGAVVLAYREQAGRHFGIKVDETIAES